MTPRIPTVLLQAGHSAAFAPRLPAGGGAPGEAEWTTQLALLEKQYLQQAGVVTVLVGSWLQYVNGTPIVQPAPRSVTDVVYSAFLSHHYDADVYPTRTGCFGDARRASGTGRPLVRGAARLLDLWEESYPQATGISLHRERRNPNTWDYYAYRSLAPQVPGLVLEHGVGQGWDHDTLFTQLPRIARADVAALLRYLNIPEAAMFTDTELTPVAQEIWGEIPFNPGFAIPKQWLAAYRAGTHLGAPEGAEHDVDTVRVQHFARGTIVYRPADGTCSYKG